MSPGEGRLAGKVALVTGSTQGLGRAVAERFVAEGARVVVTGRSKANGEKVARVLGGRAVFLPADLARIEDCRSLVRKTLKEFEGIDVIVNSAASTDRSTVENFTPEFFDMQFHINVLAPLVLAQEALESLRKRRGAIVNIGSVNAYVGQPDLAVYSATKGALMTLSRNLANALKFDRVRVYCLNVGWMDSEGERQIQAKLGKPARFLDDVGRTWPLRRLLKPSEVAEAVLFLAGAEAFSGCVFDLEQFPIGALHAPEA